MAVEVATRQPELGVGIRWPRAVESAAGRDVSVAVILAALVFDAIGDATGLAVLTGDFVGLGATGVSVVVGMGFAVFRRPRPGTE